MQSKNKSLLMLNGAIVLFGSAGLFGKLINQPAFAIVAGRVLFSVIGMYFILKFKNISLRLNEKRNYAYVILLGAILALHWILFYHAIQISTVTIGLLTYSTCPVFASFLEPLFFKNEKLKKENIITAAVAFLGVVIVAPKVNLESSMLQGFAEGILSGLTFALLTILERKCIKNINGAVISFYEQATVFIVLIPFCAVIGLNTVTSSDIFYILLLSIVFTLLSRFLYISSLKGVSAQTASVLTSLEPVYGIILSFFILNEVPSIKEIAGGIVILSAVVYSSMKAVKQ